MRDEDQEEDPRRETAGRVHVRVLAVVGVLVLVGVGFPVRMHVRVRAVADGPVHAPYRLGKAKGGQEPCGYLTASRLRAFQLEDGRADGDADAPQHHRAQDVSRSAQGRDHRRLPGAPAPCLRQYDERHVVVRAKDRVAEADQRRQSDRDPFAARHCPLSSLTYARRRRPRKAGYFRGARTSRTFSTFALMTFM